MKWLTNSSLMFAVVVVVVAMTGCAEPTTGIVSGTILVDDEPAETGSIVFSAVDRKSGPVGTTITDGEYTAEIPLGDMNVEIRVPIVVGQKKLYNTADSPISDVMEESLPPWYNDETELIYTVETGESVHDFELSRSKKRKKKR